MLAVVGKWRSIFLWIHSIPLGVYRIYRCEHFFWAFFSMFLQTIKFFGCSNAMYDSLLSYIILDDVILLQHSHMIQGIPCKLKVLIWAIYMSEKLMLGSWNRAFSIEFEKSIRKSKNQYTPIGYINIKNFYDSYVFYVLGLPKKIWAENDPDPCAY